MRVCLEYLNLSLIKYSSETLYIVLGTSVDACTSTFLCNTFLFYMNYFFWTKYPFVQLGFAFIGGNALAYTCTDLPEFMLNADQYHWLLAIALTIAIGTLMLLFYHYKKRLQINGLSFFLIFICLGSLHFLTHDERYHTSHLYSLDTLAITGVLGEIITEPEQKNHTTHFVMHVQQIKQKEQWIKRTATIKVALADTCWHVNFQDIICLKGSVMKPLMVETPYDFNYSRWLAHQNIHYTLYAKTQPILIKMATTIFSPKHYAIKARQKLEDLLDKKIKHPRAYALVTGLLIGKRSELEEEDKQLFTTSGTIHVLAVSGMHVVLIYQCLSFLASLFRIRKHTIVFNLSILTLIWFYIFITGLQASASRAAIMITLVLMAKLLQRDNQNTNSLFATACLMLLYNPYYLADAGFILSFLAVAGILISSSLSIQQGSNKIWTYLFNASLISTAAQTATFPYSIHLFQQFPVYFLLANLIVVPLTTLLLLLSILLLIFYSVPYVNDFLIVSIEAFTDGLFYILQSISYLPWPIISHISLSTLEMCLLYAMLLMTILLFAQRKIKWMWGITLSVTLLSSSLHYRMIRQFHQPAFFICGKKEHRQYLLSSGHQAWFIQDRVEPSHRASEAFLTDHFIDDCHKIILCPNRSFILQQCANQWGIVRKKPITSLINDSFLKNCDAWILDYTRKYAYLDPDNKLMPNKKIFFLYSKKSFYSTTSFYELDTD